MPKLSPDDQQQISAYILPKIIISILILGVLVFLAWLDYSGATI